MPLCNQILAFPTLEDQRAMQQAVTTFLQCPSGHNRKQMLADIKNILNKYHISKFNFPEYTIATCYRNNWPTVRAKNSITGNHCPGCRSNIYSFQKGVQILNIWEQTRRHYVTYGCRCGKIFGKWEQI